jgi:hypothetical protein
MIAGRGVRPEMSRFGLVVGSTGDDSAVLIRQRQDRRVCCVLLKGENLIRDEFAVDPFIRLICTRWCFTTTNMIQVCSNFH